MRYGTHDTTSRGARSDDRPRLTRIACEPEGSPGLDLEEATLQELVILPTWPQNASHDNFASVSSCSHPQTRASPTIMPGRNFADSRIRQFVTANFAMGAALRPAPHTVRNRPEREAPERESFRQRAETSLPHATSHLRFAGTLVLRRRKLSVSGGQGVPCAACCANPRAARSTPAFRASSTAARSPARTARRWTARPTTSCPTAG